MKKKILSLTLVVCLLAIAVVGGTLAYFTDKTAEATNVFTVGEIEIALHEATKDGKYVDDAYLGWLGTQTLIPTTEAKKENLIDKVVTVENTGVNDAYMWAEIWIPASLDDGDANSDTAPGKGNNLHFNYNAEKVVESKASFLGSKPMGPDGALYNGYVHYEKNGKGIATGESTCSLLEHVYMDAKVAQCTEDVHADNCLVLMDGTHYAGSWEMIVYGVGIQADTFSTVEEAIAAYYGKTL